MSKTNDDVSKLVRRAAALSLVNSHIDDVWLQTEYPNVGQMGKPGYDSQLAAQRTSTQPVQHHDSGLCYVKYERNLVFKDLEVSN